MNATPELAPPTDPAPAPRRRRWWLIAVAAVVVLAAAVTAILLTRPSGTAQAVPCGGTGAYCFPGADVGAVTHQLTAAGFTCRGGGVSTLCAHGGDAGYVELGEADGQLISVWLRTQGANGADGSVRQLDALLGQVLPKVLPGADGTQRTITDWIAAQAHATGACPVKVHQPGGFVLNCTGTTAPGGKTITGYDIDATKP